ncbi:hypothetical protein F511_01477 [Dorcoceras hygrometricum]|uniref:Histone-lysine N-methyltransferase SUVR4 n=1 Tax=Dorcoceras hygrometricum TaxID=472368 RepID=A0A2Z7BLX8_9LAMI|nr:hypothetical protein F511_01477 [Dorcoceras hygrometricum]
MKRIGISEYKVKPVLKSLLKLFDKNWGPIEDENYRALADAIFERDEVEGAENSKKILNGEKEDCLEEETQASEESGRPLKRQRQRNPDGQNFVKPKEEPDELLEGHLPKANGSNHTVDHNAEKEKLYTQVDACQSLGANKQEQHTSATSLINEKQDHCQLSAMSRSQQNTSAGTERRSPSHPMRLRDRGKEPVSPQSGKKGSVSGGLPDASCIKKPNNNCGVVLSPSLEQKTNASNTLIKPKDEPITDDTPCSGFPVAKVHPDTLNEGGALSTNGTITDVIPEVLVSHTAQRIDTADANLAAHELINNVEMIDSGLEIDHQPLVSLNTVTSHDGIDIAKGLEKVLITIVNEVNDERPPSFFYIPQNAIFQNAYLNFSLARMGDNNCCGTCSVDCLLLSTPCACAHETGGEFAYTTDGLVKEDFLNECISMNRDPKKHCQFFCKECVLERSKSEDVIEPCKGHLVRKFIKECWWKCGCNILCGNRVVQRGITRKLQVFMAPEGKGWGLRTLEDLPKGAFVCEYVGEVLTNAELFDRVLRSPKGEKHSYPVLLDADWGAEEVLKDEEALCLDATYYGNVARFINHRCYDSNMVEIPVEVETPDHHYYHLAFFTTRNVKAMEELTWDYGIDFDDHDHPIKAFRCQCGSKFCRNIKRPSSK